MSECHGPCETQLASCPGCGRHVKVAESSSCPFCKTGFAPGAFFKGLTIAAFFGAAAIPGCAYGPPPDFDTTDDSAEVDALQSDGEPDGGDADGSDDGVNADVPSD